MLSIKNKNKTNKQKEPFTIKCLVSLIAKYGSVISSVRSTVQFCVAQYYPDWCFSTHLIDVDVLVSYAASLIQTGVSARS